METTSNSMNEEIKSINRRFEAAIENGDVAGIVDLYTGNGVVLPAGFNTVKGKEEIQNFWETMLKMGIKQLKLETLELETHDTIAIETGKYRLFVEGNQEIDHGKYMVVWKRENERWKLDKDIWNSSVPAPTS